MQPPSIPASPPSPQIPVIFVGAKRHSGETTRITKDSEGRWGNYALFPHILRRKKMGGGGVGEGRREGQTCSRLRYISLPAHTSEHMLQFGLTHICKYWVNWFVKKTGFLGLNFAVLQAPHFTSSVNRNRRVQPISIMKNQNRTHNEIQLIGSTINRNPAYNAVILVHRDKLIESFRSSESQEHHIQLVILADGSYLFEKGPLGIQRNANSDQISYWVP